MKGYQVNDELERMWKETVVAKFKEGYYPSICLEGLTKPAKNLSQDSRSPDRELYYQNISK
jgi:hypothetical protein